MVVVRPVGGTAIAAGAVQGIAISWTVHWSRLKSDVCADSISMSLSRVSCLMSISDPLSSSVSRLLVCDHMCGGDGRALTS